MHDALAMPAYDTWTVLNTSPDQHTLGQWNSVCTISNGYLGLKGNLAEQRDGDHPVTLIHGVFDELDMFSLLRPSNEERPHLDPRYFDRAGTSPAVANLPDPLFVRVLVNGRELSLGRGALCGFSQQLDLRNGLYSYGFEYRDGTGATRIQMERFACLRHAHRVYMRYSITPLDYTAHLRIASGISARVRSNLTAERPFVAQELFAAPPQRCHLVARTPVREHTIRLAVANRLSGAPFEPYGVAEHEAVYTQYAGVPQLGQTLTLTRCVVLTSSEDLRHGVLVDPDAELQAAESVGFDDALAEQSAAWSALWQRCDVQIEGDDPAQLGLRFCIFHLLQAAPRFTDRLSVPIKLLTGEHYQGATFYDTDLYIVPFYTLTQPGWARTCLRFRFEGLRPGRELARSLGYDGAKLSWLAGPYGEECLGNWWRFTHTNIHINADVAHAVMHYYRATGDEEFLSTHGIDLLVETARFYASRAIRRPDDAGYDLREVAGPDEGHCDSTNNFYTNYLARRNLLAAAEMLARLSQSAAPAGADLQRRLALRAEEPDRWREIAGRLRLLYDPQTQLYEQCEGFFALPPLPADLLEKRRNSFIRVAPYQAIHQPDVLMALALLPAEFTIGAKQANWEHYHRKSMNFSSVSFSLHCLMALEVGDLAEAYRNFVITTGIDLDEALTGRQDTYAGLHGTALGGAWLAAVCGFGGVRVTDRGLQLVPRLPQHWTRLRFQIVWHDLPLTVCVYPDRVELSLEARPSREVALGLGEQEVVLRGGQTRTFPLAQSGAAGRTASRDQ